MKSFADAHGEIKGFAIGEIFCLSAKCEIKSVPLPDEVGFHHEVISSTAGGFIPDERTDLAEKRPCLSTRSFFLAVPNHLDATLFFEKISNKPCFFQKF